MQFEPFTYKRGEMYLADLGENTVGSVQRGVRPVIIIQNDKGNQEGPTLIVVPLTTQIKKLWLPTHVRLPKMLGLEEVSMALCEQITTIDKSQVIKFIGTLGRVTFSRVQVSTLISLGFMPVERRREAEREGPNDMILTLCQEHKQPYMDCREYRVLRLNHFQHRERCTLCDKMGYDYKITHIQKDAGRDN